MQFRSRLHDPRFWVIQAVVVVITAVHALLETFEVLTERDLGAAYLVPASLYFIPTIYASLNFGREGAIPTAIWSSLLAIPNILVWHTGPERMGEAIQLAVMVAIAVLVATRVDREGAARRRAEAEESARRLSEAKYVGLFSSAGEAILVLTDRTIEEANSAAGQLAGVSPDDLRGRPLADLLGTEASARLLAAAVSDTALVQTEMLLHPESGVEVWVEPVCNSFVDAKGEHVVQVILRDVTRLHARQRGLETYAHLMLRAQEDERLRIARDIHDGVIQSLVLLCRKLDALRESASSEPWGGGSERIDEVRRLTESIADELRRISRALRPAILDDLGLVPAIRWLVQDVSSRSDIAGLFHSHGTRRRMRSEIALCVFRIAQEALQNVERHAQATRVNVAVTFEDSRVRLDVLDNGRGLPPVTEDGPSQRRFGIIGMKERARLVGGDLNLESAMGAGTRLRAWVPLEPDRNPAEVLGEKDPALGDSTYADSPVLLA